jgi:hypothetical protein
VYTGENPPMIAKEARAEILLQLSLELVPVSVSKEESRIFSTVQ